MKLKTFSVVAATIFLFLGCGGNETSNTANLSGQVAPSKSLPTVTHYGASRFLEHASMGPSPSSVAQVKKIGLEGWINNQMKLPPTIIKTPSNLINFDANLNRPAYLRMQDHYHLNVYNLLVGGEDQLRIRTTWVLSNFLVVSQRKVPFYGMLEAINLFQNNAFGQYGDLLKNLTRNAAMGFYLDNVQNNQRKLNENYGRELMQLFSVGLVQLNMDGTTKKSASGKILETYSQKDVIEITRALTGWAYAPSDVELLSQAAGNYDKPMVEWPGNHDTGSKTILGKTIPAGQDAKKDLDSLVEILMEHPNTAPFVSLRLIQGMTTSDPSPAYITRVATIFRDSKGNLAKVITAILTDPEARQGDTFGKSAANFGRIKEPLLVFTSGFRGLGCKVALKSNSDPTKVLRSYGQEPFYAYSVFNYYPPNHRTQGSNVLAPEQKMLTSTEFSSRMLFFYSAFENESLLNDAGCDVSVFKEAQNTSIDRLIALMSERYFRGALPESIAGSLSEAVMNQQKNQGLRLAGSILDLASLTPAFGVSE